MLVADPGDNFTFGLNGGLPENSTLERTGEEYAFKWNLHQITDRTLEFTATDTREARSVFMPRVEICACKNGGTCTLTGVISDMNTVIMNCLCPEG